MDTDAAIAINDLTVRHGMQTVLSGFHLTVAQGQTVVLSGPSGCGKSTVLKCLLGLVRPTSGTIDLLGQRMGAETVWTLRRSLAYVPQEPDLGTGTVHEALEHAFAFRANETVRSNLNDLSSWLERVDLPLSVLTKSVTELSGGEKQRVALVGALLLDRPILLLDEVTAALDEGRRQSVVDLIRDLPCTRLIVTHDTTQFGFTDRVVTLVNAERAEL
jgi:putative ABC transport system ATP-binding protein